MSENESNPNQNPYQAYPYYYYPQASQAYYPSYEPRQNPQMQNQQVAGTGMGAGNGTGQGPGGMLPTEQSYIENILRLNQGKVATVYMSFENNAEWSSKVFKGIVEAAGRDHIILSDPKTEKRYLLLMIYLNYVTFEGEINYSYPYGNGGDQMAQYSPR